jgi:hypothetical protein
VLLPVASFKILEPTEEGNTETISRSLMLKSIELGIATLAISIPIYAISQAVSLILTGQCSLPSRYGDDGSMRQSYSLINLYTMHYV